MGSHLKPEFPEDVANVVRILDIQTNEELAYAGSGRFRRVGEFQILSRPVRPDVIMRQGGRPAKHGTSIVGMPPIEVSRGTDGELVINNGVTRAARYVPGTLVPVEVIDTLPIPGAKFPTIKDLL